ncbi:MAG: DUF1360 domain-containing protein [bacterium]
MSIELRFLCAMLATWRLTHLFTAEDGPADVVVRIRARLGDGIVGRAMDCFYCLSIWIAAPIALFVSTSPITWSVVWLALSGGACLLDRVTTRAADDHPATDRAKREGEDHELLWTATSGTPGDVRTSGATEARIAGTIGVHPPWIPW